MFIAKPCPGCDIDARTNLNRANSGVRMSDCLRCEIHDMLEKHLQGEQVNLAEIASKVTEVLADS